MRGSKPIHGAGKDALQPTLKAFDGPVTSAHVASLESRLNGQQKRIRDLQATCNALWDAFKSLGPLKPGVFLKVGYEDRIPLPCPHEMESK